MLGLWTRTEFILIVSRTQLPVCILVVPFTLLVSRFQGLADHLTQNVSRIYACKGRLLELFYRMPLTNSDAYM